MGQSSGGFKALIQRLLHHVFAPALPYDSACGYREEIKLLIFKIWIECYNYLDRRLQMKPGQEMAKTEALMTLLIHHPAILNGRVLLEEKFYLSPKSIREIHL